MKNVEKLIGGTEIDLEELEARADHSQIKKVYCNLDSRIHNQYHLILCCYQMTVLFSSPQHYKISSQELEISSVPDAITCRIAARDAL